MDLHQLGRLRHIAQSCKASSYQSWDLQPGNLASEPTLLSTAPRSDSTARLSSQEEAEKHLDPPYITFSEYIQ